MVGNENADDFDILGQLKQLDPDKYTACLYVPEEARNSIACLYLFDAEISRIPSLISEPMPGEIRLQFWRDILTHNREEDAGPLGKALLETIKDNNLSAEVLYNYLNAKIFDLYNDPMPNMGSFEGYLGETQSAFLQLSALCLKAERSTTLADACGHSGMAIGVTKLLSQLAWHHNKRRIYIPAEILSAQKLNPESWLNDTPNNQHQLVINQMHDLAINHLKIAIDAASNLPKQVRSIFVPLSFVKPTLQIVKKRKLDVFKEPIFLGDIKRQWSALKWAMKSSN